MNLNDLDKGNVDFDGLEKLLNDTISELQKRHDDGKSEELDKKAQLLVAVAAKLWKEKDGWKQMYYELYDRYNKHLDKEIETLSKMLPRRHG